MRAYLTYVVVSTVWALILGAGAGALVPGWLAGGQLQILVFALVSIPAAAVAALGAPRPIVRQAREGRQSRSSGTSR